MSQSRNPLRLTTIACAVIIAAIVVVVLSRACSHHEDAFGNSNGQATEAVMARLDSIEKQTAKEKASRKDSSASSGKRSKKEKAPRKKPVERSFLDEDVNR